MTGDNTIAADIVDRREAAYESAIRALAKYKFWMFGYHAAAWVKYNQLLKGTPWHQGNPFNGFVRLALIERGELPDALPHETHKAKQIREATAARDELRGLLTVEERLAEVRSSWRSEVEQ